MEAPTFVPTPMDPEPVPTSKDPAPVLPPKELALMLTPKDPTVVSCLKVPILDPMKDPMEPLKVEPIDPLEVNLKIIPKELSNTQGVIEEEVESHRHVRRRVDGCNGGHSGWNGGSGGRRISRHLQAKVLIKFSWCVYTPLVARISRLVIVEFEIQSCWAKITLKKQGENYTETTEKLHGKACGKR